MSAVLRDAIVEIQALVKTTINLPAGRGIFRDSRMERLNWRALIQEFQTSGTGGLQTPYIIVAVGKWQQGEFAALDRPEFDVPIEIHIIDDVSNNTIEAMDVALEDLRDAFPIAPYTNFQILENDPLIDSSVDHPANALFLEENQPLIAGSISIVIHLQP